MSYKVYIVNNATGEGRWYLDCYDWDGDFIWTDGNFGCDCNRALFWSRAGGEEDLDVDCGHTRFSIPYVELGDGIRVKIDEEEPR